MGNTTYAYSHTRTFPDPGPLSAQPQINPGGATEQTTLSRPPTPARPFRMSWARTQTRHWDTGCPFSLDADPRVKVFRPQVPTPVSRESAAGMLKQPPRKQRNSDASVVLPSRVQLITGLIRTRGSKAARPLWDLVSYQSPLCSGSTSPISASGPPTYRARPLEHFRQVSSGLGHTQASL